MSFLRRTSTDDHERRLNQEIDQLVLDIRRIGPTYPPPQPRVLFGELFEDEQVEQYYEALVGTLKSAKKRGIVNFKGQILFKGVHDKVVINIVDESPPPPVKMGEKEQMEAMASAETATTTTTPNNSRNPKPIGFVSDRDRRKTLAVPPSFDGGYKSKVLPSRPPPQSHTHPAAVLGSGPAGAGTKSGSTPKAWTAATSTTKAPPSPPSLPMTTATTKVVAATAPSLPLTPQPQQPQSRSFRTWKSTRFLGPAHRTNASFVASKGPVVASAEAIPPPTPPPPLPASVHNEDDADNDDDDADSESVVTTATAPAQLQPVTTSSARRHEHRHHHYYHQQQHQLHARWTSSSLSASVNERVTDEIARLPLDIRRIDPLGEPWCRFGDLFDDDDVQQHYEALVGTLKSAKRRGIVRFQGQMLLKGMHDAVRIEIVTVPKGQEEGGGGGVRKDGGGAVEAADEAAGTAAINASRGLRGGRRKR